MKQQVSAPETGFVPFRRTRAPVSAFVKILQWMGQATQFAATGLDTDEPDHGLLLAALDEWWIGFAGRPEVIRAHCRTFIRVTFQKPRGEGLTTRDFDPALLAFAMLLCAPGGRLALEDHGPDGGYYYVRLYIHGRRQGNQRRRTYFLRVAADTPPGRKTKEPKDFRSVLRQDLATYEQEADGETTIVLYSTAEAKQDSIDRWRELEQKRPDVLPAPKLGTDGLSILLDLGRYLLSRVPLGVEHQA
jgi:hypothetical protein